MTAARQRQTIAPWSRALPIMVAAAMTVVVGPLVAATTEYVVVDRHTGLAISGFDPVAYFTDGAALPGRETFEYPYAGVVWRFRNEGNRAAFKAHPDIYMPRFGGYDPVGLARGAGIAGNPRHWLIVEHQLFLFYTPQAQAAFSKASEQLAAEATAQWPAVQRTLSP